jgi:hypothetical protein
MEGDDFRRTELHKRGDLAEISSMGCKQALALTPIAAIVALDSLLRPVHAAQPVLMNICRDLTPQASAGLLVEAKMNAELSARTLGTFLRELSTRPRTLPPSSRS